MGMRRDSVHPVVFPRDDSVAGVGGEVVWENYVLGVFSLWRGVLSPYPVQTSLVLLD